MRLALVQMTSQKANIYANISRMIHFLDQASDRGAEIVCFPEMKMPRDGERDLGSDSHWKKWRDQLSESDYREPITEAMGDVVNRFTEDSREMRKKATRPDDQPDHVH